MAGMISSPDSRPMIPNVYLGKPEYWSMAMVLRKRPRRPDINPRRTDPKVTEAIAVNPRSATRKYSDGPNSREIRARGGASSIRAMPLINPPATDANVDIRIASMAFPLFVNSYPSMAEAAEADVPGARMSMAEKDPP